MKSLQEYIIESKDSKKIELPYTFDLYNSGSRNVDYKITKNTIYRMYFASEQYPDDELYDKVTSGNLSAEIYKVSSPKYNWAFMIKLPLPASEIRYKDFPTKSNTDNWTKLPDIVDATYGPAFSEKASETYNWSEYNYIWTKWLNMIKPYMHGKISVTMQKTNEKDEYGHIYVELHINDRKFNAERDDKIKELSDPSNLKKFADEATAKEKAELEKKEEEERKEREKQEKWDKWWNSLSAEEQERYKYNQMIQNTYGYGSGRYNGD